MVRVDRDRDRDREWRANSCGRAHMRAPCSRDSDDEDDEDDEDDDERRPDDEMRGNIISGTRRNSTTFPMQDKIQNKKRSRHDRVSDIKEEWSNDVREPLRNCLQ